jgi:hypothetical protein
MSSALTPNPDMVGTPCRAARSCRARTLPSVREVLATYGRFSNIVLDCRCEPFQNWNSISASRGTSLQGDAAETARIIRWPSPPQIAMDVSLCVCFARDTAVAVDGRASSALACSQTKQREKPHALE